MKERTPKNVILESLKQDIHSRDDDVRHQAILHLGEIGTDEAVSTLINVADAKPWRKLGPISLRRPGFTEQLEAITVLSYSESDEAKTYVQAVASPDVEERLYMKQAPMPTAYDEAYSRLWLKEYPNAKGNLRDLLERKGRYNNWRRYGNDRVRAKKIVSEALERVNPESTID